MTAPTELIKSGMLIRSFPKGSGRLIVCSLKNGCAKQIIKKLPHENKQTLQPAHQIGVFPDN